jgi:prepilin-type N-terminal cleavage/methylation domain-containing protein
MERVAVVSYDSPQDGSSGRRGGFTLVELLAVIMIIALLAALVTPAVMRARNSARNAAIKAEIDMLHMAIMNYKNEYGSFPPAYSGTAATDPAAKHILRNFPRTTNIAAEVTVAPNPGNAIVGWLGGYSENPTAPVSGGSRRRLFDFDQSRTGSGINVYFPSGAKGSPYIYLNGSAYGLFDKSTGTTSKGWPASSATYTAGNDSIAIPSGAYYPTRVPTSASAADWTNTSQPYFNPDTFQILCAGADGEFGTDDDLSNFWKGTRKDYLESLK